MSDILELVGRRYTCKDYDPEKKLTPAAVDDIKTILRNAPSSSNIQAARYLFISGAKLKEQIAAVSWDSNKKRIINCSHLIVFCGLNSFNGEYFDRIYQQEEADGRFAHFRGEKDYFQNQRKMLYTSASYPSQVLMSDDQVNIALGFFLLGVQGLGINATPMGGFTRGKVDELLELSQRGWHAVCLVAVGYTGGESDFNLNIPKSRLPAAELFYTLD